MSDEATHPARILCVTGPAGAGRQTALRSLEDIGFEAIDNLPLRLVGSLADNPAQGLGTALGLDPRSRGFAPASVLDLLSVQGAGGPVAVELVYLDCSTPVLLQRFSSTRRRHPMAENGTIEAAIEAEKALLAPLRARASVLIDTSNMTVHDLRAALDEWFSPGLTQTLQVEVHSFSYKRGLPHVADMVFDCRFLRNPYWQTHLRELTGQTKSIQDYVTADPACVPFEQKIETLVASLLPAFVKEGKSHLAIAFGCTGGKHRSVTIAERCGAALAQAGWQVSIVPRELERLKQNGAAA